MNNEVISDEFELGDWVWFLRTKVGTESYTCPTCHHHNTSKIVQHQEVALAQIRIIRDSRYFGGNSTTMYELSNPEIQLWCHQVIHNSNEPCPIYRTKEEAEAAMSAKQNERN